MVVFTRLTKFHKRKGSEGIEEKLYEVIGKLDSIIKLIHILYMSGVEHTQDQ